MSKPYEVIAKPFTLYVAPVGTVFPKLDEDPGGTWLKVGTSGDLNYSPDGVTVTHGQTVEKWRPLGSTGARKAFRTEEEQSISLVLVMDGELVPPPVAPMSATSRARPASIHDTIFNLAGSRSSTGRSTTQGISPISLLNSAVVSASGTPASQFDSTENTPPVGLRHFDMVHGRPIPRACMTAVTA